ncbi:MAG: hypothetical protein V4492_06160 [Chlamydiota bacterium]
MKYQNLLAFEKHLEQAAPNHPARVYLVVSSCSYERRKIVDKILAAIRKKEEIHLCVEEAAPSSLDASIEKLNTSALFGGKLALYLDAVDKLKKPGHSAIAAYAASPSAFAYLILGAGSGKGLSEIYTKAKKELIICDLSDEKPWERKERLKRHLLHYVTTFGHVLSPDAAEYLLENVGLDLAGLEQELFKLVTYAADRKNIGLKAVETMCFQQKSSTIWQMAENLVWKGEPLKGTENVDLSLLLPLLSQIRVQLQQGLSLALLQEQGFGFEEISHYLPTMRSHLMEKLLPIARQKRPLYFKRGLRILFEIELMAKNSSIDPALLLELLSAKLRPFPKRIHHALPSS